MANLQVRVDDDLKLQADALFASMGLDTSAAVRVFLKQSVLRGRMPFELRGDPYLPYLKEADARARAGEPTMDFEEFETKARAYVHALQAEDN